MEFQQPDTLAPEPYNPQTLNRYEYALDNPIRYNDPTGHMATDCSGGKDDCGPISQLADDAHNAYVTQRDEELNCEAGDKDNCSYAQNHPVAYVTSFLMLPAVAAVPEAGVIADAVGWKTAAVCATSSVCWTLTGAGGAAATTLSHPDYYVTSDGDVIPSTGYRYSAGEKFLESIKNGFLSARPDGTYFTFENFSEQAAARSALQMPYTPQLGASFDTLQIINDIQIPHGMYGTSSILEPITTDFPGFGVGGATQAITFSSLHIDSWWWLK